ncbi:MAG TPA: hypothetical protein VNO30_07240 [Kofleriaceae bacterium]|nr:hypothetical protein [Kofleriaceae bacterium]
MLLPAIQYGPWSAVKKRMRTVVSQLKRGNDPIEVMTRDGMLDCSAHPGMLVLSGIMTGPVPNFHCFMPWKLAWGPLFDLRATPTSPAPVEDAIFEASLQTPWGILGLLANESNSWLIPTTRHEPFLHAVLGAWSELDAVGARYYAAVQGERLWSVPNNLHYVLANMGVPAEILNAPLPAEGPRALLRYARPPN